MKVVALLAVSAAATLPGAAPIAFDMKDPKGVSGMGIRIDGLLEPVRGHATGVSGKIEFDAEHPENSKGKLVIDISTLKIGSPDFTGSALGDYALDVKKFPTAEFTVKKVDNVKASGEKIWTADVTGDFTLHGVTKEIKVPITATHLVGMLKRRGGMPKDGDLLKIRSTFTFNRHDYGIAKDMDGEIIGTEVEVDLHTIGVAPK